MTATVAYVWSYTVRPEHLDAFRRGYGPDGEWATFYRQASGYLGTELLQNRRDATRFVTIDRFVESSDRERLIADRRDDYDAIDRRWETTTVAETFLGEFVTQLDG